MRGRLRPPRAAVVVWPIVVACAVVVLLSPAPAARADFDPAFQEPCSGTDIIGAGATLQRAAQQSWAAGFVAGVAGLNSPQCPDFTFDAPPSTATINYTGGGSGAGRQALLLRQAPRWGSFDQAPTAQELGQINAGPSGGPTDDAELRSIPVTQGAVTIAVNFPDGCTIDPDLRYPTLGGQFARFVTFSEAWEIVFFASEGDRTWGALMPGIQGPGCADRKLVRVVREDNSGTTFLFKSWLARVGSTAPSYWNLSATVSPNVEWPFDSGEDLSSASPVLRGAGNSGVADKIRQTDGSIGYVDLADARLKGFDKTGFVPGGPNTTPAADDTYWVPVQNGAGRTHEPTANVNGYRDASTNPATNRGANCSRAAYNIPAGSDPTLGSGFSATLGVNSTTGYGICGLSYVGVWDDYCDAYGNTAAEQAKARSVVDYYDYVVSGFGQTVAQRADYAVLPPSVLTIARDAVDRVGWNKPGSSCAG